MLLKTSTRLFAALPPEKTTMPFRLLGFGDGWRDGAREALTLSVDVCMMIFQASAGSVRR